MRILCLLAFAAGCGGTDLAEFTYGGGGAYVDGGVVNCQASNECPAGDVCNDFGRCEAAPSGDGGAPPPEVEYELGAPISSQRYVYVAMTEQNELARIDGATLEVTSIPVGSAPREVATIPGTDGAVVLDSYNGTATIVRPSGATNTVRVLPTLQHLNAIEVDPTGRYAVLWFDLVRALMSGSISNIGSFQDVTVVALAPGAEKAVNLTVGFRPRNVQFDAAGNRAYVITQDGVSVIDLADATQNGPHIVAPIPVADPSVPADDLEVQIVSTGEYAAVRQLDASALRVVNVGSNPGQAWTVPLASAASDIDLAPDGSRVYAVLRDAKKLAIIDIPGDAQTPSGVENIDLSSGTLGSLVLSSDGSRGLLFTNATVDERITMVDLASASHPTTTWPLVKTVRAVGISPAGDTALILDGKTAGDPSTAANFDEYIDRSYGYTLLDLSNGFGKLQITPVDAGPFHYAPDGSKVYVGLDGGDDPAATRALQVVNTHTGVVTTKALGSPPSAIGILPTAAQAFVAQRHPLGRVTFVDLASDAVRTVTGFDLNSHVVQ